MIKEERMKQSLKKSKSIFDLSSQQLSVGKQQLQMSPQSSTSTKPEDLVLHLLWYVEQVQEILELSKEKGNEEGREIRYKGFNGVLKRIMEEKGRCLLKYKGIPLGQVMMEPGLFDFGEEEEYYSLDWLTKSLWYKTKYEDESYWSEKTTQGYYRGDLMLCMLWFLLQDEVMNTYHLLEVIGRCPDTPMISFQDVIEFYRDDDAFPHFNLNVPDFILLAIRSYLIETEWMNNRKEDVGLIPKDVTKDEWLSTFKGATENRPVAFRKIPWKSVQALKSFVELFLDNNYDLAEKVFCWVDKKGIIHEIKNLHRINNTKNDALSTAKNGLIAQIIEKGKSATEEKKGKNAMEEQTDTTVLDKKRA